MPQLTTPIASVMGRVWKVHPIANGKRVYLRGGEAGANVTLDHDGCIKHTFGISQSTRRAVEKAAHWLHRIERVEGNASGRSIQKGGEGRIVLHGDSPTHRVELSVYDHTLERAFETAWRKSEKGTTIEVLDANGFANDIAQHIHAWLPQRVEQDTHGFIRHEASEAHNRLMTAICAREMKPPHATSRTLIPAFHQAHSVFANYALYRLGQRSLIETGFNSAALTAPDGPGVGSVMADAVLPRRRTHAIYVQSLENASDRFEVIERERFATEAAARESLERFIAAACGVPDFAPWAEALREATWGWSSQKRP